MHIMQGRTAKLNISLNTSSTANQSNLGVNNNYSNSIELRTDEAEDEEDMDVPENVEEIIEMLLSGLRDM
ncbi:beta-tubulin folding cofactor D, partial [Trifolium medium]|nr:beta-tubulin folding cofactor D [Trifolium medium]